MVTVTYPLQLFWLPKINLNSRLHDINTLVACQPRFCLSCPPFCQNNALSDDFPEFFKFSSGHFFEKMLLNQRILFGLSISFDWPLFGKIGRRAIQVIKIAIVGQWCYYECNFKSEGLLYHWYLVNKHTVLLWLLTTAREKIWGGWHFREQPSY